MFQNISLKEQSFLVYGLGSSGQSVVNFFKKINLKILKFGMISKKIYKNYRAQNLKKSLNQVNFIVLSPGVSLLKNKILNKFKKKNYYRY